MLSTKQALTLIASLSLVPATQATTIFDADFDASTAVTGSVTNNASVTNLDAGTSVGNWALSGSGGADPGAIVANASQDNNAFVFDTVISGGDTNRVRGEFSSGVDLASGQGLEFSIDFRASRSGSPREVRLSFDDATDSKAYVVIFDLAAPKSVKWLDTGNTRNDLAEAGANDGFTNAGVDNYLSWPSGTMSRLTVTIPGTLDNTTGSGNSGALVTIDWNGDGLIDASDGDIENVAFGPRNAGITDLASFELFYSGSNARGMWVDNIQAESIAAIPEPGSLALLGLGGLMVARRRRG